jgi:hypothetical protein
MPVMQRHIQSASGAEKGVTVTVTSSHLPTLYNTEAVCPWSAGDHSPNGLKDSNNSRDSDRIRTRASTRSATYNTVVAQTMSGSNDGDSEVTDDDEEIITYSRSPKSTLSYVSQKLPKPAKSPKSSKCVSVKLERGVSPIRLGKSPNSEGRPCSQDAKKKSRCAKCGKCKRQPGEKCIIMRAEEAEPERIAKHDAATNQKGLGAAKVHHFHSNNIKREVNEGDDESSDKAEYDNEILDITECDQFSSDNENWYNLECNTDVPVCDELTDDEDFTKPFRASKNTAFRGQEHRVRVHLANTDTCDGGGHDSASDIENEDSELSFSSFQPIVERLKKSDKRRFCELQDAKVHEADIWGPRWTSVSSWSHLNKIGLEQVSPSNTTVTSVDSLSSSPSSIITPLSFSSPNMMTIDRCLRQDTIASPLKMMKLSDGADDECRLPLKSSSATALAVRDSSGPPLSAAARQLADFLGDISLQNPTAFTYDKHCSDAVETMLINDDDFFDEEMRQIVYEASRQGSDL